MNIEKSGISFIVGENGSNLLRKTGDKTPRGREYTSHAAERANQREFSDQSIDNIIDNNSKKGKKK